MFKKILAKLPKRKKLPRAYIMLHMTPQGLAVHIEKLSMASALVLLDQATEQMATTARKTLGIVEKEKKNG